jgi:hypothetical protein
LDLDSGSEHASMLTHSQSVESLTPFGDELVVVGAKRMFLADEMSLEVSRDWRELPVTYAQQSLVIPGSSTLVVANWLKPTVGTIDLRSGETRRLRADAQPTLLAGPDCVDVYSAESPKVRRILAGASKMAMGEPRQPVRTVARGREVWAILPGELSEPPSRVREPSLVGQNLDTGMQFAVPPDTRRILVDDAHDRLWLFAANRQDIRVLDQTTGQEIFGFRPGGVVVEIDPEEGVLLAIDLGPDGIGGSTSLMSCYSIVE